MIRSPYKFTSGEKAAFRPLRAFTLIELILVMALITIAAGLIAPSLSRFFRGRTQDAEAFRLLSLTHYGQSRAISEGIPTVLWLDSRSGTYGLRLEAGYTDDDRKAVNFTLDKDLRIGVVQGGTQTARPSSKLPGIHFLPDGTVSPASVNSFSLEGRDSQPLWIVQSANGLNYEIQNQTSYNRAHR